MPCRATGEAGFQEAYKNRFLLIGQLTAYPYGYRMFGGGAHPAADRCWRDGKLSFVYRVLLVPYLMHHVLG